MWVQDMLYMVCRMMSNTSDDSVDDSILKR